MRKIVRSVIVCLLWVGAFHPSTNADEPAGPVAVELAREILAPDQTLKDTQKFSAARIPSVPQFGSADEYRQFAETTRAAALDRVVFRGAAAEWRKAWTKVEHIDTIEGGPGYSI